MFVIEFECINIFKSAVLENVTDNKKLANLEFKSHHLFNHNILIIQTLCIRNISRSIGIFQAFSIIFCNLTFSFLFVRSINIFYATCLSIPGRLDFSYYRRITVVVFSSLLQVTLVLYKL